MAARGAGKAKKARKRARPHIARRRLRLLWGVLVVAAAVYLYYRPISSYLETRSDLAARRAEVEALRQERTQLQLRLLSSTSVEAREREARRLGYVKPGERLFVVKGVDAWKKARSTDEGRPR